MIFEKKDIPNFCRKLYRLLDEHPEMFVLKKMRKYQGRYEPRHYPRQRDDSDWVIMLDYRTDILSTLVHEAIHHFYPEWTETKVLRAESNIMNQLSVKRVKTILQKLADAVTYNDSE